MAWRSVGVAEPTPGPGGEALQEVVAEVAEPIRQYLGKSEGTLNRPRLTGCSGSPRVRKAVNDRSRPSVVRIGRSKRVELVEARPQLCFVMARERPICPIAGPLPRGIENQPAPHPQNRRGRVAWRGAARLSVPEDNPSAGVTEYCGARPTPAWFVSKVFLPFCFALEWIRGYRGWSVIDV